MQTADLPARPGALSRHEPVWRGLSRIAHSPWFAYLTLALLQLHVVWGAWDYRDLTTGDTADYYALAHGWACNLTVNVAWSPLYTAYYGTTLWLIPDVWAATLVHRLVLVFAASLLALAVLRRLLPSGLAWLAAAWWACLPIVFNTLYEVHLFSALPVLLCWLLLLSARGPWRRGAALAVLAAGTVLVRNELALACVLTALLCLGWEVRDARRPGGPGVRRRLLAYALPLLAVAALCLFAYVRTICQYPELQREFRLKHTVNMAQVYSFGYQQRHPEWTRDPWTEYHELMTATFGKAEPWLTEMLAANPRAVRQHFTWNARLLPGGLELLLFNASGGKHNPDYVPAQLGSKRARRLGLLTLGVLLAGCLLLAVQWSSWWTGWLQERAGGWRAILALVPVWALVILTQRPRPSYLFTLSLALMAAVGMAVYILLSQVPTLRRRLAALAPAAMVALCLLVRPYYVTPEGPQPHRLRAVVARLSPFEELLDRPGTRNLLGDYASEIGLYVGKKHRVDDDYTRWLSYAVIHRWKRDVPLEDYLTGERVDVFYLNEDLLRLLQGTAPQLAHSFLGPTPPHGWELIGHGDAAGDSWRMFRRVSGSASGGGSSHRT
jgi:hypothetical protein